MTAADDQGELQGELHNQLRLIENLPKRQIEASNPKTAK